MSDLYTGTFAFRCVRPTYLGQGISFEPGELHHFRFISRALADDYLKNSWGWGSEDFEVIDTREEGIADE
jgi:hypothetical protein